MSTNGGGLPPGASTTSLDLSSGANGDAMGDLSVALAMLPGLTLTPDGVSAFGASTDQQATTLNGADYGGAMPRDGLRPSVYLSTYDPRQGRFAGTQIAYTLQGGSDLSLRLLHVTAQDPPFQWGQSSQRAFSGPEKRNVVSGMASGPLVADSKYYSVAFQIEHRDSDVAPVDAASHSLLTGLQLDPDLVADLTATARAAGLPLSNERQQRGTTAVSIASRIDLIPGAAARRIISGDPPQDEAYLLASTTWRNSTGVGLSPTAAASVAGSARHVDAVVMGELLTYRLAPFTSDSKLSLSATTDVLRPSFELPGAVVTMESPVGETSGLVPVSLGGASGLSSNARDVRIQGTTDLSWQTWDRAHRVDLFLDGQAERYRSRRSTNSYGMFEFASPADFARGSAIAFTRTLGESIGGTSVVRGTVALSDTYTAGRGSEFRSSGDNGLTIQAGIRLDAEHFGKFTDANPDVESKFQLRTGSLRPTLAVQPMVGFTWNWTPYALGVGDVQLLRHRNALAGGIRDYRGLVRLPTVAALGGMSDGAGLVTVRCVGPAVPTPDWAAYLNDSRAIPAACERGSSDLMVQRAPSIGGFARRYTPEERWSGQLTYRRELTPFLTASVSGAFSRVSHTTDLVDLNLSPISQFELAGESARPMFISAASIVPSSGVASSVESRTFDEYARVMEYRSDGRRGEREITTMLNYSFGNSVLTADVAGYPAVSGSAVLSYTRASGRIEQRGFAGTTDGNPFDWTNAPLASPEHTIRLGLTLRRPSWWTLNVGAAVTSGLAFTPLVSSDINGDGLANDRAFVFGQASDSIVQSGMDALFATSPGSVRACLRAQLGAIARPNSCRGSWSASVGTISLAVDPYRLHLGSRANLSFSVMNALAGIDQLLHGSGHLRGWGQMEWPNSVLLNVRGFDPMKREFSYSINPTFGRTGGSQRVNLNPASIAVDFRWDLGPSPESQRITRLVNLEPAVTLNDSSEVKLRLLRMAGIFRPDIDVLLSAADSLNLSADQIEQLREAADELRTIRDSIYTDLAGYLASRVRDLDAGEARQRWHTAAAGVLRQIYAVAIIARTILSNEQQQWLKMNRDVPSLWYTKDWLDRTTRAPIVTLR